MLKIMNTSLVQNFEPSSEKFQVVEYFGRKKPVRKFTNPTSLCEFYYLFAYFERVFHQKSMFAC